VRRHAERGARQAPYLSLHEVSHFRMRLYCGSLWFCIVRVKSYRRMETPCDFSLLRFPCTQQVLQELVPELIKKLQLQESTRASFMFTAFERLHREARSSAEVARDSAYGLSIAIGLTDADLDAQEPTTNRHFACVWCPRVALATVRLIPSKPATLLATLRLVLACGRKDFLTHSSEEGAVSAMSLLSPACKSWLNVGTLTHGKQLHNTRSAPDVPRTQTRTKAFTLRHIPPMRTPKCYITVCCIP